MNDATLAPTEAQKRDEAIEAALRHADRVRLDWTGQASRYLIEFAQAPASWGAPMISLPASWYAHSPSATASRSPRTAGRGVA